MPELEKILGYQFQNSSLLVMALTHSSLDAKKRNGCYERLEFLGDRVLGLGIATLLYNNFSKDKEGAFGRKLAYLCSREVLVEIANKMQVEKFIKVSPGTAISVNILADTTEAILGAIFLDSSFETVKAIIHKFWETHLFSHIGLNPKTMLQQFMQQKKWPLPEYSVVSKSGLDHVPSFKVRLTLRMGKKEEDFFACGPSVKDAQGTVARLALNKLTPEAE